MSSFFEGKMEGDFVFSGLLAAVPAFPLLCASRFHHGPCCHCRRWFWWALRRAIIKERSGSAHIARPAQLSPFPTIALSGSHWLVVSGKHRFNSSCHSQAPKKCQRSFG